ncbi:hypothetical protein PCANC_27088 [Puccinia coronata f. sp. avenae]|uniref:Uncharacterized protein n=1 Tax=Puccinia coronata f. sp. avenae TaxID=200324 RepID=A0A2N5UCR9_9BASI|nr:hypothetical protein PCASD_17647 [Puccinia coronata f. sp. avenae]PLW24463.1 hypothetical protein PCANC_27088 [Puccinia coronata f. sp. avenae]PLW35537.1 hypothetical protein PCASD_14365 [Puccinia coronata f. sp. avenae]
MKKGFANVPWLMLLQLVATTSLIFHPASIPDLNLPAEEHEEALTTYQDLAAERDHSCDGNLSLDREGQQEQMPLAEREAFSHEDLGLARILVSLKDCSPLYSASSGTDSPPPRKRKTVQMKDISSKSQRVSIQAKESSRTYQSVLMDEPSQDRATKNSLVQLQTSDGTQEEAFNMSPSGPVNHSAGEHTSNEVPHDDEMTIFHISPQPEPGALIHVFTPYRDSPLSEYFNPGTNLASLGGNCPSVFASSGQVSPTRKRKKAQMTDISDTSQKVSTSQEKESSKVFQSNIKRESSQVKVTKQPGEEAGDDAQNSHENREEAGSNTLLPSLVKSSSGVHIDAATHEKKKKDDDDETLYFVHSQEILKSSN